MGGRLLLLRRPFWQAFYFPMQRIVILEYQTFNLLAVQMGYGKPMGIECKALRTIYFVS